MCQLYVAESGVKILRTGSKKIFIVVLLFGKGENHAGLHIVQYGFFAVLTALFEIW